MMGHFRPQWLPLVVFCPAVVLRLAALPALGVLPDIVLTDGPFMLQQLLLALLAALSLAHYA